MVTSKLTKSLLLATTLGLILFATSCDKKKNDMNEYSNLIIGRWYKNTHSWNYKDFSGNNQTLNNGGEIVGKTQCDAIIYWEFGLDELMHSYETDGHSYLTMYGVFDDVLFLGGRNGEENWNILELNDSKLEILYQEFKNNDTLWYNNNPIGIATGLTIDFKK